MRLIELGPEQRDEAISPLESSLRRDREACEKCHGLRLRKDRVADRAVDSAELDAAQQEELSCRWTSVVDQPRLVWKWGTCTVGVLT